MTATSLPTLAVTLCSLHDDATVATCPRCRTDAAQLRTHALGDKVTYAVKAIEEARRFLNPDRGTPDLVAAVHRLRLADLAQQQWPEDTA